MTGITEKGRQTRRRVLGDAHVNRTTADYLFGLVGIPVRRYQCPNCGWQGRRIHRHRYR